VRANTYHSLVRPSNVVVLPFQPQFASASRPRQKARRKGWDYEQAVSTHMHDCYNPTFVSGVWFRYTDELGKRKFAQPDGLLLDVDNAHVTIVEVKYNHTVEAWSQLRNKYEPIVRAYLGEMWQVSCLEVCNWFDPAVEFPENIRMVKEPHLLHPNEFGVTVWRPQN